MNASIKALALAATLIAGLTACQNDNLVNPSQPQAQPTEATALSGAGGSANNRTQYRLVKIDYQLNDGTIVNFDFFYNRTNQLVKVVGPGEMVDYSYGPNNTITAVKQTKVPNQPFKKKDLMTYFLNASGRAYKLNVKNFDQNENLIPGPGLNYLYLYNGQNQLIRTSQEGSLLERDTLIYNGNGDLVKTFSYNYLGVPTFEQQHFYDKPGPYAADLQPSGPRPEDPTLQGLIPDYGPLNPWNVAYVDEYQPIFGKFRKHLPKRYLQIATPGQAPNADWSHGYVLNADGHATERKTKTSGGTQWKHTYNLLATEIGPVK